MIMIITKHAMEMGYACKLKRDKLKQEERYIIPVNLQLFASGEKTEKATPKKRQDARKKGQVLQSKEITSALILILLFVGLRIFGIGMYNELSAFMKRMINGYVDGETLPTTSVLSVIFLDAVMVLIKATGPLFLIAMVTGIATGYAQVGFLFTTETLSFKLNKLNPLNGLKRIFSMRAFVELAKSVIKLTIICVITYSYLEKQVVNVLNLMGMDVMGIATFIATVALNLGIRISAAMIILSVFDYAYQWWEYEKNLKMSKQEVKEEYKQTEGNPEIKSKIKQKQRQISMRRMLHDVPKADVVITNPTHFAVAIKYDPEVSSAPVVIAKGQDFIALRIREVAKENSVEIVENKPLARNLYETVEIGQSIPSELYQAVAEVLAFVYSLKEKGRVG